MPVSLTQKEAQEDIEDPVEEMLKKTGCIDLHHRVQECMVDAQDWRKCQVELQELKRCMERHVKDRGY